MKKTNQVSLRNEIKKQINRTMQSCAVWKEAICVRCEHCGYENPDVLIPLVLIACRQEFTMECYNCLHLMIKDIQKEVNILG